MQNRAPVRMEVAPKATIEEMRKLEGSFVDAAEGLGIHPEEWTILRPDVATPILYVWKQDIQKLLCTIHRQVIPLPLCKTATECYMRVAQRGSTNRGVAAGAKQRDRSHASYEKGIHSNSGVMGYIDHTHYNRPCRLTAYSQNHFEEYKRGLPFIQAISQCFAEAVPDAFARQHREAQKTRFHIEGTAFSTVTVNYNFRTAVHRDAGDFEEGFGNLVVCQEGMEGGWLLFPRYRVAVVLETGDFMAMDVHEWHCNSPLHATQQTDSYRLSFVCYLRHRMNECEKVNERLENFGTENKINTESLCREIFATVSEELPIKTIIGTSAKGATWWAYQGKRFHIIYKNRRFVVHDVEKHFTIHNLWPALEYAKQIQSAAYAAPTTATAASATSATSATTASISSSSPASIPAVEEDAISPMDSPPF